MSLELRRSSAVHKEEDDGADGVCGCFPKLKCLNYSIETEREEGVPRRGRATPEEVRH
jgi:hypothetical protein